MGDGGKSVGRLAASARLMSSACAMQKRFLCSAYPNFGRAPSCFAQDDTGIGRAETARDPQCGFPGSCPDTERCHLNLKIVSKVS